MYGKDQLKEKIEITESKVECPVKGCNIRVERQRRKFRVDYKFKCKKNNIFISPSTFEYTSDLDNILWKEEQDSDLFNKIDSSVTGTRYHGTDFTFYYYFFY